MDIWYGTSPVPTESFSNLKYITFWGCAPFVQQATSLFLQKLHNIERIEVYYAPPEEIFVSEGNTCSWDPTKHTNFKVLRLQNVASREGELRIRRPNFSKLGSSRGEASFSQIKEFGIISDFLPELSECPRIAVIVTTDGDDAAEEITFSRLQVLTLRRLPKMQGFCSGSCIVNLPSLTTLSMSNRLKLKIFQEKLKITSKYPDTEEEKEDNVDEEIGVPSAETNIAS